MDRLKTTPEGIAGKASRRKLFFFWLVDTSGSMSGNKIQKVNWAIKHVLPEIEQLQDEERVDVYMGLIKFGQNADWHGGEAPMEISEFKSKWEDMDATGTETSTSKAIDLLRGALDIEKLGRRNVPPVCILLSDGYCTDQGNMYEEAIRKLNTIPWGVKAVRLSIGISDGRTPYNKAQLDEFISPYLRREGNVDTLDANTPRKLVQYIVVASTSAAKKSSTTDEDVANEPVPVAMTKEDLNREPPEARILPSADEVF